MVAIRKKSLSSQISAFYGYCYRKNLMNTILLSAAMFSDHISSAIISFIRTVLLKELIEAKTNESLYDRKKNIGSPEKMTQFEHKRSKYCMQMANQHFFFEYLRTFLAC